VPVTILERTLIDIAVHPYYVGGLGYLFFDNLP